MRLIFSLVVLAVSLALGSRTASAEPVEAWRIYGAIKALPSCWADRNDTRVDEYHERLSVAISEETRDISEAAAMVTIAKHEGGLCIGPQEHYTHSGAKSTFQLEGKSHLYPGPFLGLEYEPIRNATHAAVDVWRHSHGCKVRDPIAGRFSVYAGGGRCGKSWNGLRERVSTYWYVYSILKYEKDPA